MAEDSRAFVAVDGGGTHTRAALFDAFGRELLRTEATGSNPHRVGVAPAVSALRTVLSGLESKAVGLDLSGVCVGLAGRSHPQASLMLREACTGEPSQAAAFLRALAEAPLRFLREDGELARAAAIEGKAGVLLLAGTGSAAWGLGPRGSVRCGGFGPSLGDAGSAHAIGMGALCKAAEDFDRTGQVPSWLHELTSVHPRRFESALRSGELRAAELAPRVLELAAQAEGCAVDSDGAASALLAVRDDAVSALLGLAETTAQRVGLLGSPVATAGSVAEALRPHLSRRLGERLRPHTASALVGGYWLLRTQSTVPPEW
jgi:N-acetylglucosamine kinase-like BadF-type ATPase